MDEISLYEHILGIRSPWFVGSVALNKSTNIVSVSVRIGDDIALTCPQCRKPSPRYDKRARKWRHLDTCQLQTYIEAEVPRIQCQEHGCKTIQVPWAEDSSRYTALFERHVLTWLHRASISAVCRQLALSWNAVDGIMQRAINRGLACQPQRRNLQQIYVDETSFLKRRKYVTVVSDAEGHVIHIAEGNRKASLKGFYDSLDQLQRRSIKSVAMDMSPAYIHATLESIPWAKSKIVFDKFHVVRAINKAVEQTRQIERLRTRERPALKALGQGRYLWLKNSSNLDDGEKQRLALLKRVSRITSRAWRLKEISRQLWQFRRKKSAREVWESWCDEADDCGIKPMMTVSSMVRGKLWGIVNACHYGVTNAQAESINSKIKMLKAKARGFRNPERFKRAILFYCGGLDLFPRLVTHHD